MLMKCITEKGAAMKNKFNGAELLKRIEKLNKDVTKSGILADNVTPEQSYLLEKIIRSFSQSVRHIEVKAPLLRLDRLKVFLDHLKFGNLSQKFELGDHTLSAEYAILFPEYWTTQINKWGMMTGVYLPLECDSFAAERFFFGLTWKQQKHLTFCYNQNPEWGNIKINGRTGRAKLIENFEQFIAYFEKGGRQC